MDNTTLFLSALFVLLIILATYYILSSIRTATETEKVRRHKNAEKGSVLGAQSERKQGETGEKNTQIIYIENFAFNPTTADIKPGTIVVWVNKDDVAHNIRSDAIISPDILSGGSFSSVFELQGTYDYYCSIHPGMKGRIIVR